MSSEMGGPSPEEMGFKPKEIIKPQEAKPKEFEDIEPPLEDMLPFEIEPTPDGKFVAALVGSTTEFYDGSLAIGSLMYRKFSSQKAAEAAVADSKSDFDEQKSKYTSGDLDKKIKLNKSENQETFEEMKPFEIKPTPDGKFVVNIPDASARDSAAGSVKYLNFEQRSFSSRDEADAALKDALMEPFEIKPTPDGKFVVDIPNAAGKDPVAGSVKFFNSEQHSFFSRDEAETALKDALTEPFE